MVCYSRIYWRLQSWTVPLEPQTLLWLLLCQNSLDLLWNASFCVCCGGGALVSGGCFWDSLILYLSHAWKLWFFCLTLLDYISFVSFQYICFWFSSVFFFFCLLCPQIVVILEILILSSYQTLILRNSIWSFLLWVLTQEIRKLYSAFGSTLGIYMSRSNIENKFTKAPEENMFKTQEAEMKKNLFRVKYKIL